MNNLNFVSLIGRLTQNNELRTNTNGKSFLSNSIAVQRSFKNANGDYDTDFINVAFSGKTAEFVNEHFHKGDVISVIGNISVTTKETENGKRTFTNVNVDNVAFVPGAAKELSRLLRLLLQLQLLPVTKALRRFRLQVQWRTLMMTVFRSKSLRLESCANRWY